MVVKPLSEQNEELKLPKFLISHVPFGEFSSFRVVRFLYISIIILWDLWRVDQMFKRRGLKETFERLTTPRKRRMVGWPTLWLTDAIVSWWLVAMKNPSVCFYRALVMLKRLSSAECVDSVELIICVFRDEGGRVKGHAELKVNEGEFRVDPSVWTKIKPIVRLKKNFGDRDNYAHCTSLS